jgi:hypothetical protein
MTSAELRCANCGPMNVTCGQCVDWKAHVRRQDLELAGAAQAAGAERERTKVKHGGEKKALVQQVVKAETRAAELEQRLARLTEALRRALEE